MSAGYAVLVLYMQCVQSMNNYKLMSACYRSACNFISTGCQRSEEAGTENARTADIESCPYFLFSISLRNR